jgi:hypothetical protein
MERYRVFRGMHGESGDSSGHRRPSFREDRDSAGLNTNVARTIPILPFAVSNFSSKEFAEIHENGIYPPVIFVAIDSDAHRF